MEERARRGLAHEKAATGTARTIRSLRRQPPRDRSVSADRVAGRRPITEDSIPDDAIVARCDAMASDPHDPKRVAPAVEFVKDVEKAVQTCEQARKQFPDNARIMYELGRVQILRLEAMPKEAGGRIGVSQKFDEIYANFNFLDASKKGYGVAFYALSRISKDDHRKIYYMQAAANADVPGAAEQLEVLIEKQKTATPQPPPPPQTVAPSPPAQISSSDDCSKPKADEWLPGATKHAPWETHEFQGCKVDPGTIATGAAALAVGLGYLATEVLMPEQRTQRNIDDKANYFSYNNMKKLEEEDKRQNAYWDDYYRALGR